MGLNRRSNLVRSSLAGSIEAIPSQKVLQYKYLSCVSGTDGKNPIRRHVRKPVTRLAELPATQRALGSDFFIRTGNT